MSTQAHSTERQELPKIHANGANQCLIERYICSYLLYDYNLSHAYNSFYNSEYDRDMRAAEKAKASPLDGRSWEEQLTWAYNQVLSEDTEGLIAHIQKCGGMSRAEYEAQLAVVTDEYRKLPAYGKKEEH